MKKGVNTISVGDLKQMITRFRGLEEEDPVAEMIEIFEGFEVAMSQRGTDESADHQRVIMLVGIACEMGRRMKELESALDRIGNQLQTLSPRGLDMGLIDLVHRAPKAERQGICE